MLQCTNKQGGTIFNPHPGQLYWPLFSKGMFKVALHSLPKVHLTHVASLSALMDKVQRKMQYRAVHILHFVRSTFLGSLSS